MYWFHVSVIYVSNFFIMMHVRMRMRLYWSHLSMNEWLYSIIYIWLYDYENVRCDCNCSLLNGSGFTFLHTNDLWPKIMLRNHPSSFRAKTSKEIHISHTDILVGLIFTFWDINWIRFHVLAYIFDWMSRSGTLTI